MTATPSNFPLDENLGIKFPIVEICDIGAMSEGDERFANLVARGQANLTGFEPNPNELAKLIAMKRPRRKYLPYFLGRGGPATFHLTYYPGCSSLLEPDASVINLFTGIGAKLPDGNFVVVKTEPVQTVRLDDVPELPHPIDYLKLDVQGGELDVLSGATKTLEQALVIELEAEFVPIYKNQPLFGDVQLFLREQGFMLHKMIDVGGRTFRPFCQGPTPIIAMSQLLWADAVFVRDVFKLDRFADQQLLKTASILHEVYRSYDLANYLLGEHDRRLGSKLCEKYLEQLKSRPLLPRLFMNEKQHP